MSNYWKKSNQLFNDGIDTNKTLPDHAKKELKKQIGKIFKSMSGIVATVELIYLREKQHK